MLAAEVHGDAEAAGLGHQGPGREVAEEDARPGPRIGGNQQLTAVRKLDQVPNSHGHGRPGAFPEQLQVGPLRVAGVLHAAEELFQGLSRRKGFGAGPIHLLKVSLMGRLARAKS